ncbi:MAG: o-succinylbenzoate synthase [Chitinophagales bacterium]
MLKAWYKKYALKFKSPVLTSRGQMQYKNGYYLLLSDGHSTGIGECSFIEDLSVDDFNTYEAKLQEVCDAFENGQLELEHDFSKHPSIAFGYETALLDYENGGRKILYESDFTEGKAGIPINGLVWMGDKDFMLRQIQQKLDEGFICIKIKVGAINFEDELRLLSFIREQFPPEIIEIRLDANGGFNATDVHEKLKRLAEFKIHSIEQPLKPGQFELMRELCATPVIPIAVDEELIAAPFGQKAEVLIDIKPQYAILKPSLLGGYSVCNDLIMEAGINNIGWWITSALESNIGLNAIAQWTAVLDSPMHQGLGTGSLYDNNVESPLFITEGMLAYNTSKSWGEV